MELQPIDDNRQRQSLTTALKNICRDYPAGGTVLRELLQNADDAGATEVRFFLDQTTYPVDPLIHTELGKYQGPALLAYNNAVFTDTDFKNLSRLGDSLKLNDGSTTGKFGRGFNSVYNWTDSPSIVTRERLLILDPHMEWSPGGNVYDFAKNSDNIKIKNQMAAFQSVMKQLDQKLDGTIIRIPLRTQAQAKKSDISNRETTVSDVVEVLRSFASEFGDSGLLFMRNVEKLELGSAAMSISIQMGDGQTLRSHKLKVNNAVKCALENPEYSFDHSFEAGIEFSSAGESKKTTFMVHHSIQCDLIESGLRDWAKDQKLIPWVAVAAQVPISPTETVTGSLFTVLPLPIATSQPVHIHGLFSISPDRARLYQFSDNSTQDQDPAKWNNWLLQSPVPVAWTKLLSYLARVYPRQPAFERWPQSIDDIRNPLSSAMEKVIGVIEKDSLALWPTDDGYVTRQDGLLGIGVEPALGDALREVGAPVVYVPQRLQQRAKGIFRDRLLCPKSLCQFMRRRSDQIRDWSDRTKHKILEYLLSEPGFIGYGGLELFPFKDGVYRSVGESIAFVHRDKLEETLFRLEDSHNLDLEKLSETAQHALKDGCRFSTIHPSIRFRSASCLRKFCVGNIFNNVAKGEDMTALNEECTGLVSKVWTWISRRGIHILDEEISGLWLLPLSNGKYRKVIPRSSSSQAYLAPTGEIGELMWKFDAKTSLKPLPLFDIGPTGLASDFVLKLTTSPDIMSKLFLKDANNIVFFLEWFDKISHLVEDAPDEEKLLLARLIASKLAQRLTSSECSIVVRALTHLKIFQKVSWKAEGDKTELVLAWTTLSSCGKSIGLLDGISPVPAIDGVQFLIAKASSHSEQLLQGLRLADCLGSVQVIRDHIIPAWKSDQSSDWTPSCKEQASEFILRRFPFFSHNLQVELRTLPMVPVAQLNGKETSKFALAADLIDPSVPELKELCFDDEAIAPKKSFYRDFGVALKGCGLKTAVDEAVVGHRVRCYANAKYPLLSIQERAQRLLKSSCRWNSPLQMQEGSDLRRLKWLPAKDLNGTSSLKASYECRGRRDRLLACSQLPIIGIPISSEWEERLGWDTTLPDRILLSQLSFGVQRTDRKIVDAVLIYISAKGLAELVAHDLKSIPCIISSSGSFVTASQAVRHRRSSIIGCERLQPYLTNVDHQFWEDHESLLLTLGIGELQLTDLLQVQGTLEAKSVLEESDVAVAIEILNLASKFPSNSWTGLKAISEDRKFYLIHDINFNDLGALTSKQKVNLTHPDIPKRTIRKLGIGSLSERLIKGLLEIEDVDDDDEFEQRENVATRIGDTLDRYPVESTFREYLANADDAKGASKVSWLLDERTHPYDKLLTPEMKRFQGPSFLVRNDGVFSENDFKGLKNVGEGSKSLDKETIGQFGRGSQTMYHWTDVPMILSGDYLLILDPQQQVLPWNQIKGKRKPGVKLLLSKLKDACCDQLAPFEGLWGYTQDLDHYPGTIFRFPLRNATTSSILRTGRRNLDCAEVSQLMATYFNEARISLLFLRKIKSIDFHIHGKPDSGWSIARSSEGDPESFCNLVTYQFIKNMGFGERVTGKDKWWVAIEDLQPTVARLPQSSRRVMKNVECGIAALQSSTLDGHDPNIRFPSVLRSKIFNTLPLPISSDLPIHIHATFSLSGDRQSIAINEYGIQSYGSEWNRYLLQEALPKLYLLFLDYITPGARQRVFDFWPQEDPPRRSCSELLCTSFWAKLPHSSLPLFPKAEPTTNVSRRRPTERFNINQAVFDFLPKSHSEKLAPLLISLEVNLVRDAPPEVAKRLKALPEVTSITGSLLRSLLKSERSKMCLLGEMEKNPRVLDVLLSTLLPTDDDLKDLDGCHILPLADGSLATLKLVENDETQSPLYHVASEKELMLFDFASRLLVPPSMGKKFDLVLESRKFNLTRLRLCHVKDLLSLKPEVSTPVVASAANPEGDKWLTEFWEYWNGSIDSCLDSSNLDNLAVRIFRATRGGVEEYISPLAFHRLPAVIEPSIGEHQQLCSKIPGIHLCNPKFMPKLLVDDEKSFNKEESFYRFIRALRILARQAGVGIGTFVAANLDLNHVKILRSLIVSNFSNHTLGQESKQLRELIPDLKSIPLWPRFNSSSPEQLLSANDALMAVYHRFLVPWMKDSHRFVNTEFASDLGNQACLSKLGVRKLTVEVLLRDHVLPLPSTLSTTQWEHFKPLIAAISELPLLDPSNALVLLLTGSRIAADGNRNLRKANELYDHEDQVFLSAFRQQGSTKFLHDSVRGYRSFWLRVGLRRTGNLINPAHYLQCLQELKVRLMANDLLNDPHLPQDSRTVLSLMTTVNSNTHRFATQDWRAISEEAVFQSRTGFNAESEYRRSTMASVAAEQRLLRLSDIISHDRVAVCWSQTPFALLEPTREVLGKVSGNGQPKIDMVWRHLQHMAGIARDLKGYQARDFLTDLHLTYEYLQDHLDESRVHFHANLKNSAIWLNLDTADHQRVPLSDIKSSWHEVGQLVLSSSCDAGSIKAVRPGLMRYEKLLRALGCSSITYPTITRPTLHHGSSVSNSLRKLRDEGKLLDVTYSTEGKLLKAHRVMLAAMSEKCALQFSGRWSVEDVIEYDEYKDPEGFLSYHTLSTMIKYAYEDEINWEEMEVSDSDDAKEKAEKLDLLLDLHKGADYWLIPALMSQVEDKILVAGKAFINLENVVEVRERADRVGAKAVKRMCAEFIEQNKETVAKAHSGTL